MNWEAIGAVAEILGAIAVVATLVYLSAQIRQNNRMIQRDAHLDRIRNITDPLIGSAGQLAQILEKMNSKDGSIKPVTRAFMQTYDLQYEEAISVLRYLYRLWAGYESDFLFTGQSEELDRIVPAILSIKNNRLFWEHEKEWSFAPEFVAYVDSFAENGDLS